MFKIVCEFCGKENFFTDKSNPPRNCSNKACQFPLNTFKIKEVDNEVDLTIDDSEKKLSGLELIYQKTNQKLKFNLTEKVTLGRESYGYEILGNIPQISRNHCVIEFSENKFKVTDLNSTNGTFIGFGNEQISCKTTQFLNNNDFLVLGKEVFLVKYIYEKIKEKKPDKKQTEDNVILCTQCSCVLKTLPCSCPECGAWNE